MKTKELNKQEVMIATGQIYKCTAFNNMVTICEVLEIGIEGDGRGTIRMGRISETYGDQKTRFYKQYESTFVIELSWFTVTTGNRKVERVTQQSLFTPSQQLEHRSNNVQLG